MIVFVSFTNSLTLPMVMLTIRLMAHAHCTGLGKMGFYIMLCMVDTIQGHAREPFISIVLVPVLVAVPVPVKNEA